MQGGLKLAAENTRGIFRNQSRNEWLGQGYKAIQQRRSRTAIEGMDTLEQRRNAYIGKINEDLKTTGTPRILYEPGRNKKVLLPNKHHEKNNSNQECTSNDNDGNLLTNKVDILTRWVEYFRELLGGEPANHIELKYRNKKPMQWKR